MDHRNRLGATSRRTFVFAAVAAAAAACGQPRPQSAPAPPPAAPAAGLLAETTEWAPLHVGYCGAPGSAALGRMTGDLAAAGAQLTEQMKPYEKTGEARPVVELIATQAHRTPGADGLYRSRAADKTVQAYLDQARAMRGMLLLNIQPGQADFLDETRAYERWLAEPDVGVALDPEWAVPKGTVPGESNGEVTGAKLDQVATYLSELVARHGLPDKVLVYHQVAKQVVVSEADLGPHQGVVLIKVADGIGGPEAKRATWTRLMENRPEHIQAGFKLFYQEDTRDGKRLMTPEEVLGLDPSPSYVLYE